MARQGPRQKSEYGLQLLEKQKIRNEYGLREKQFRGYFEKGNEPEAIFGLLESRLDSVVYNAGFANSRSQARQLVNHGHIGVNGRKVTIPSYQVRIGDVVAVLDKSKQKGVFGEYKLRIKKYEPPIWLTLDKKKMEAKVNATPGMDEEAQPFDFQTVIEFYNR